MDWNSALKGFQAYLILEKSLSRHSIDAYQRDCLKLMEYVILNKIDKSPDQLSPDDLVGFIHYINDLGLEEKSQARIISGIKSFYRYLLVEDIISSDPTEILESPKLSRDIPDVLSYQEIQSILQSIDMSEDHAHRNRAILETLYASGMRVSELTNLRISHYFEEEGFVQIIGKNNKERIVPISDTAMHHIRVYLEQERSSLPLIKKGAEDVLFLNRRGGALSRVMIFNIIKKYGLVAGIQKNISPHTFRHSFATHLIEGGADLRVVQELLGHESILTTEIYTHLDRRFLRDTLMKYHPMNATPSDKNPSG